MNTTTIIEWLLTTNKGHCALREALCYLPDDLVEEFLGRWRPAYVLVKVYRGGEVEVLGEKHVLPKVVWTGRLTSIPEAEIAAEERVEASLPEQYKLIHFPSNRRLLAYTDLP